MISSSRGTEARQPPLRPSAELVGVREAIGMLLRCPGNVQLMLWLLATLAYGGIAGALLHGHPRTAAAVLAVVWVVGAWRGGQSVPRPQRAESTTLNVASK